MMNFRKVKTSIENILIKAEDSRYVTIGFQRQSKSAIESLDFSRMVQIYYSSGEFDKSTGSLSGPVQHDVTFNIDLTVSKAAEGDMSAIINPSATQQDIIDALANFSEASQLTDESIDQLINIIYQELMDAENYDLGMDVGIVSNRWINRIQKNDPLPRGEYVTITASMQLTCRVIEIVEGDTGTPGGKVFDTVVDIVNDDVEQTGVIIDESG
jgi:hypothetical protein